MAETDLNQNSLNKGKDGFWEGENVLDCEDLTDASRGGDAAEPYRTVSQQLPQTPAINEGGIRTLYMTRFISDDPCRAAMAGKG